MKLRFTKHALERMTQRKISPADCEEVFAVGEVIEKYPNDKPFVSELRFAIVNSRPLHIITAKIGDVAHLITAYEPLPHLWNPDFKTRKSL